MALNQQPFSTLLTFIDFAKNFRLGFLEINSRTDLDTLIESLKQHPDCQDIQFAVFDFTNQEIRFVRDAIVEKLLTLEMIPVKKLVLFVRGLEDSVGIIGDYPPILQDINFVREAFPSTIPHPLIFCLPDYAITRFIKFAPDFWAWNAGLFNFKSVPSFNSTPITKNIFIESLFEKGLDVQKEIDTLQRLLSKYSAFDEQPETENYFLTNRVTLLSQLGMAYHSLGNSKEALECLQKALKLVNLDESLIRLKAALLHDFGIVYVTLEQLETAISSFQEALALRQYIGDFQGEAETLSQIAMAYISQGKLDQVMPWFQQALAITQEIKDIHGQVKILHQMAKFYVSQSQYEEAIASNEKILQIYTRQNFPEDWAMTVNNLAIAYSERTLGKKAENLEHAINYYHQALQVYTRDAFPQPWAITQNNLGNAYSERILGEKASNLEQAIHCYQQALQVHTREISPKEREIISNNFSRAYQNRLQLSTHDAFSIYYWPIIQHNILGTVYQNCLLASRAGKSRAGNIYQQVSNMRPLMNEDRRENIKMIQALLNHPHSTEQQIFGTHWELLDAEFVQRWKKAKRW
jgi:tetratricopeptide (TPR) repeat protein